MSIESTILTKLLRRGAFGANHYRIDTLSRMGWKPHERGRVKEGVDALMRRGLVRWYNRHKGAVQLTYEGVMEANRLENE